MATETASGAGEPGDRPRVSGYDQLRTAREAVEEALLSPTGDTVRWQATMTTGLRTLEGAFRRHREVSEAPGGTLDEAVKRLPELARAARGQRLEHGDILEQIDALTAMLAGKEDTGPADPDAITGTSAVCKSRFDGTWQRAVTSSTKPSYAKRVARGRGCGRSCGVRRLRARIRRRR